MSSLSVLLFFFSLSIAQECRTFSYASSAVSSLNSTYDVSSNQLSSMNQISTAISVLYQSIQAADRGYNFRLATGYSNGDFVAIASCRIQDMVNYFACVKAKTEYIAEIRVAGVFNDQFAHNFALNDAGLFDPSAQLSLSLVTLDVTMFPWWQQAVASPQQASYTAANDSYWFKPVNANIIFNGFISASEPCADQCKLNSYAIGPVDGLTKIKNKLFQFKGLTRFSELSAIAALLYQYIRHLDGTQYANIIIGFSNDDVYGIRKCHNARNTPIQDACLASPESKYIFQVRNTIIFGDNVRHNFAFSDPLSGALININSKESVPYVSTTKPWYTRAANDPNKKAGWTDPAVSSTGSWSRQYSSPLYDSTSTLFAVIIADVLMIDSCKPYYMRSSFAYASTSVAKKYIQDLTMPVSNFNNVISVLNTLVSIFSESDRENNAFLTFTDNNGNFYGVLDCNYFAFGNYSLCVSTRGNRQSRIIKFVRNPTVLGSSRTDVFYLEDSFTPIASFPNFSPSSAPFYSSATTSGYAWTPFSEFNLPSGRMYSGPLYTFDISNNVILAGVIAGYEVNVDLSSDATTPYGFKSIVSCTDDACIRKSMAYDATVALATHNTVLSELVTPITSTVEVASIFNTLNEVAIKANTGYLSVMQFGTPTNEYYGIYNCSSPDTSASAVCTSRSPLSDPVVYLIVNINLYNDYKLRAFNFVPSSSVVSGTPFYVSSTDYFSSASFWYQSILTFPIIQITVPYSAPLSPKTVTRAVSMPIRSGNTLASVKFLGVASTDKPTNEPCANMMVRNSFVNPAKDCITDKLITQNLNIDTNKLSEVESILNVMTTCIVSNAVRPARNFYLGAKVTKNSYIIRNCQHPMNKDFPLCKAASSNHYIAYYVNPAIKGDLKRYGYIVSPSLQLIPILFVTESSYNIYTRPWYTIPTEFLNTNIYSYNADTSGKPSLQFSSSLFDPSNLDKLIGAVGGDIEEIASPYSLSKVQAASPCMINNGGCSTNAICSAYLDFSTAICTCKSGFIGDGYTCGAVQPIPSPQSDKPFVTTIAVLACLLAVAFVIVIVLASKVVKKSHATGNRLTGAIPL